MASLDDLSLEDLKSLKAGNLDGVSLPGLQVLKAIHSGASEFRQSTDSQMANERRSPSYVAGASLTPTQRDTITQLQGPAFGFLDEAAGGVVGGLKTLFNGRPYRQNYEEVRDFVRGASDEGMRQNPVRNTAAQIAMTAPLGTLSAAKVGGGKIAQLLASSGIAGITGLVSGLGDSNKSLVDDPVGVAKDAGVSGALSAAMPIVAVPLVRGGGAVASNIASRFNNSSAVDYARQKIAEAFARDNPNVADAAAKAQARLRLLGDEGRVVDAGGASARGSLDVLATLPGETKNAVENAIRQRQATRGARLTSAADDALGVNGERLAPTLARLIDERKQAAAPLYDALYKQGVFVNAGLKEVIDAAHKLGAGGEAKRIATAEMRDYGLHPDSQFAGIRELDYLKQGLDDIILANKRDDGTFTKVGAAVQGLKQNLVGIMDEATKGAYAKARAAYAGPSSVIDAANQGRKAMTMDDSKIESITAGMGASELEGFRIGAFEALRAKLGKEAGQTEILKMWKEDATREKLKAIFPNERAFREFSSRVAAEARMKGLDQVGRGSQTAARQYGAGDLDVEAGKAFGGAVADAKAGNIAAMIAKGSEAWNRVATPEPVRDAMGRILLSRGQAGNAELMTLQQLVRDLSTARKRTAMGIGTGSGQTGNAITNLINLQDEENMNPLKRVVH